MKLLAALLLGPMMMGPAQAPRVLEGDGLDKACPDVVCAIPKTHLHALHVYHNAMRDEIIELHRQLSMAETRCRVERHT